MDVRLPDGTIVRNVPEGVTRSQLMARVEKMSPGTFQEIKGEGNILVPPPRMTPSGEKPELSYTNPDIVRGHPLVRFAEGAASPFIGAGQLAANVVGAGEPVNEFIASSEQRAREAREQLGSEGVDWWKLGGTVVSPAVLAAMKVAPAGTVLGRAGQGAAVGGGVAAVSPVSEGEDFWKRKFAQIGAGAAFGGVVPPAIDVTRGIYRVGRNMIDPILPGGAERGAARIISEALGPKRAAVETELAKPSVLVPGSQPTAAEAAAGAGSPELAALQVIAAQHKPSVYSDIAEAQKAARLAAIRRIGQTHEQIKAAEAIRAASAAQNYGAVRGVLLQLDKEVNTLLARPSMGKAIERAKELAQEAGETFKVGEQYPVQSLHYVKMALDDMITAPERFGIGASEVNAIRGTRGAFMKWLETKAPAYERARIVYANQSKPINEMKVGQELEKALTKSIGEGERPGVFGTAMREAPRTIKKATGQPRFEDLDEVLKPENLAAAKNILADLARKAEVERLAPLGRSKASQAAQPFGLPATGPIDQQYMIFKTILGRVSKGINEKTLDTVADVLQLPETTLRILQKAPTEKQSAMIDSIISAKLGRGAIAAAAASTGSGVNEIK